MGRRWRRGRGPLKLLAINGCHQAAPMEPVFAVRSAVRRRRGRPREGRKAFPPTLGVQWTNCEEGREGRRATPAGSGSGRELLLGVAPEGEFLAPVWTRNPRDMVSGQEQYAQRWPGRGWGAFVADEEDGQRRRAVSPNVTATSDGEVSQHEGGAGRRARPVCGRKEVGRPRKTARGP